MQRSPLVVVLLLLSPMAFAQIYTWTDAGGTVHYSEAPPAAGVRYKQVKVDGGTVSTADVQRTPAGASSVDGTESTAAAPARTMADTPANRAKLCATLTANLATLRGKSVVVVKQNGKNVALEDSQRKAQLATTEAQYQQYCQSTP